MTLRTSHATITFRRPFELDGFANPQPAGEYRVEVDEEVIEGISFLAYRRVAAMLYLPAITAPPGRIEVVSMTPSALDAMLEYDRR